MELTRELEGLIVKAMNTQTVISKKHRWLWALPAAVVF